MKWEEIEKGREYALHDEDIPFTCVIRKMTGCNSWLVKSSNQMLFQTRWIDADSPERAMWCATLMVYDNCNRIANSYHKIRDHLPDIHELARDAGI